MSVVPGVRIFSNVASIADTLQRLTFAMTQIPQTPRMDATWTCNPRPARAWRRLLRAAVRPTRGTLLAGVPAVAGFRDRGAGQATSNAGLEGLREGDLVRLPGHRQSGQLPPSDEIVQRDELATSTDPSRRGPLPNSDSDALGILAGTTPASGPGIVMTIRDPQAKYTAAMLLDALQELPGCRCRGRADQRRPSRGEYLVRRRSQGP